jgi:hypothetical protein
MTRCPLDEPPLLMQANGNAELRLGAKPRRALRNVLHPPGGCGWWGHRPEFWFRVEGERLVSERFVYRTPRMDGDL